MNTARLRHLRLALLPLLALLAVGCGAEGGQEDAGPLAADPGPVHVHGLGVNPRDGALFVATHTGLYRAAEGERKATRVGDRYQDTMGFTVVGPDHFLGSGHPDGRENLPPFLGLIESTDAGRTWRPLSLLGKADFHVLEAAGRTVYGFGSDFETRKERLLVSQDRGRDWSGRSTPQPLIDLAIDPEDSQRVVASSERGLLSSDKQGRGWQALSGDAGLLVWPAKGRLFRVDASGRVAVSRDRGRGFEAVGEVGGQPAAFEAEGPRDLYVALHDGTVKRSLDGGASWAVRAAP